MAPINQVRQQLAAGERIGTPGISRKDQRRAEKKDKDKDIKKKLAEANAAEKHKREEEEEEEEGGGMLTEERDNAKKLKETKEKKETDMILNSINLVNQISAARATVNSNDAGSGAVHPGPVHPGAVDPGAIHPGAVDPGAVDPGAVDPGAIHPGAIHPGAVHLHHGTVDPGTIHHGTVDPGAIHPGAVHLHHDTVDPGTIHHGTVDPGAIHPGAVGPGAVDPGTVPLGTSGNPATSSKPSAPDADTVMKSTESKDDSSSDEDDEDDRDDRDDRDDEDEEGEDKWSPNLSRKLAGLGIWDLRLEGTVKRWKQRRFLMADGPKNSTSYRLCKSTDMEGFDDGAAPDLMLNRFGEEKFGNKFTYGKAHAKAIQGVAWFVDRDVMARFPKDFPEEVDLVKPKNMLPAIATTEQGQIIRMKVVDCIVKIKWLIAGRYVSSWESRQTVRRIWGLERGDKGIYIAARHQEDLFQKWDRGDRPGRDQSPTPFRGFTPGRDTREETPAPGGRETPTSPTKRVHFKEGGQSLQEWKNEYYEWNDLDPRKMTKQERDEMKEEWEKYKNALQV